ncbi:MAG: alanine:cation symporter family protein, partial [Halioglobus sp.]|nr:alanine:cation symporter family protein [Halioglobus sp.]
PACDQIAAAISSGGPGAIFWMWVCALVGLATTCYTARLALMYRGRDDAGELEGGSVYVISAGTGQSPTWNADVIKRMNRCLDRNVITAPST